MVTEFHHLGFNGLKFICQLVRMTHFDEVVQVKTRKISVA